MRLHLRLRLLVPLATIVVPVAAEEVDPYPRSPIIRGITWAPPATIFRQAKDSDNWPLTWADDDHIYTAYGDGTGFPPKAPEKLSLGLGASKEARRTASV